MNTTTSSLHRGRLGWSQLDIRYRWGLALLALTLVGGLGWYSFYHYKQFVAADSARIAALSQSQIQQQTINDLTSREKALLAVDSRRSQQLADAQATIRRLQSQDGAPKSHL